MNTTGILSQLKAERDRLDKAIAALEGLGVASSSKPAPAKRRGRRGGMSAAGRKKISEMMKARWAARRKGKKG